mgnify:FL=1
MRIGIIGAGFVAQNVHIPIYHQHPDVTLSAICDHDPVSLNYTSKLYDIERVYTNHRELLQDPDIDAVIITLPRRLTFNVVFDAIDAGKWVFTEKPLCLNWLNGSKLHQLCGLRKVGIQIGYMKRFDAVSTLAKDIIQEKKRLETLKTVNMRCLMGDSYAGTTNCVREGRVVSTNTNNEMLPECIAQKFHWSYEQYINVFSHMTSLIEYILDSELELSFADLNENGEGIVMFRCDGIPVSFHTVRGIQKSWEEDIEFIHNRTCIKVVYPAAFLRNVPGTLCISGSSLHREYQTLTPLPSWAFTHQADMFVNRFKSGYNFEANTKELNSAIRQVKLAEQIYNMYVEGSRS